LFRIKKPKEERIQLDKTNVHHFIVEDIEVEKMRLDKKEPMMKTPCPSGREKRGHQMKSEKEKHQD